MGKDLKGKELGKGISRESTGLMTQCCLSMAM